MLQSLDEKYMFTLAPDEKGGAADSSPAEEESEPESEEPEQEAEGAEEEHEEPVKPAPGVGPKKRSDGPPVGSPRWNQIYAKAKNADRYAQFGSPEQVDSQLRRLQRYDEQIEAATKKAGADSDETEELKLAREKVEAQLKKMFKWFDKVEPALEDQEITRESLRQRAAEQTVEVMEAQGLKVDEESYTAFSKVLGEIIASDRRLFLIYKTNPERAVKDAAERYAEPFRQTDERKRNAALIKAKEPHKGLPKTAPRSAGGPGGAKPPAEPQSIKEAEARFLEGLKQLNRG